LLLVADQDYVGVDVTADYCQLAAVGRPTEVVAYVLGFEVGDLLSRGAVEILLPEIVDVAVANGVDNRLALGGEADRTVVLALELDQLLRLAGDNVDQGQVLFVLPSVF
jgi:hypothetical protein